MTTHEDHGPGCDGPLNCTCTPNWHPAEAEAEQGRMELGAHVHHCASCGYDWACLCQLDASPELCRFAQGQCEDCALGELLDANPTGPPPQDGLPTTQPVGGAL